MMRWKSNQKYCGDRRCKRRFLWFPLTLANESGSVSTRWLEMATIEYRRSWNYNRGFHWTPVTFIDQT